MHTLRLVAVHRGARPDAARTTVGARDALASSRPHPERSKVDETMANPRDARVVEKHPSRKGVVLMIYTPLKTHGLAALSSAAAKRRARSHADAFVLRQPFGVGRS